MFLARLQHGQGFHYYPLTLPDILYNAIRWERVKAIQLERDMWNDLYQATSLYIYAENSKTSTKTLFTKILGFHFKNQLFQTYSANYEKNQFQYSNSITIIILMIPDCFSDSPISTSPSFRKAQEDGAN